MIAYPSGWEDFRETVEKDALCKVTSYSMLSDAFEEESKYSAKVMERITGGLAFLVKFERWPDVGWWWQEITNGGGVKPSAILPREMFNRAFSKDPLFYSAGISLCPILQALNRFVELDEELYERIMQLQEIL